MFPPSVPPPYMPPAVPGLVTVTAADTRSCDGRGGNCCRQLSSALTKLVVCAAPFQLMVALLLKLVPLTVSTKAAATRVRIIGSEFGDVRHRSGAGGVWCEISNCSRMPGLRRAVAARNTVVAIFMSVLLTGAIRPDERKSRRDAASRGVSGDVIFVSSFCQAKAY